MQLFCHVRECPARSGCRESLQMTHTFVSKTEKDIAGDDYVVEKGYVQRLQSFTKFGGPLQVRRSRLRRPGRMVMEQDYAGGLLLKRETCNDP